MSDKFVLYFPIAPVRDPFMCMYVPMYVNSGLYYLVYTNFKFNLRVHFWQLLDRTTFLTVWISELDLNYDLKGTKKHYLHVQARRQALS